MWRDYAEVPEAITNSLKIAEMCDLKLDREGYHLPFFPVPEGYDAGLICENCAISAWIGGMALVLMTPNCVSG